MKQGGTEPTASPHWLDAPRNVVIVVLGQGAVFFLIALAIWYGSGRDPADFLRLEPADLLVAALLGGALIGSMETIVRAFPRFIGWAAEQQRFLFPGGRRYRRTHILLISVAAGVGEEALFRGGLQSLIADHLPAWAAILAASLLFVLVHLGSRAVAAFIFVYSVAFGIAYHYTGSLAGVMLAHMLFDIWAIVIVQRELVRSGLLTD